MATAGDGAGVGPERAYAPDLPDAGRVTLDASESAHLVRSRRAREGERVVLFDGRGRTRAGTLAVADPRAAVVDIEGPYPDRTPRRRVRLAVALPEAGRADRMVAACAELGVAVLAPLETERTPPGRSELASRRATRWRRLAVEAAKVNGCGVLLAIHPVLSFGAAVTAGAILLDPDPAGVPLRETLADAHETPWLLVGPEGGFTPTERALADEHGTLRGQLVLPALRVETAALAAAVLALQ